MAVLGRHDLLHSEGVLLGLLVAAVRAFPDGVPDLDLRPHGRGDDTGHADVLGYFVALKTAQLRWHLVGIDLHLELGALLHVEIVRLKYFSIVDDLSSTLKCLDELGRSVLELGGELVVEGLQFGHVEFQKVVAALSIIPELLTINENVVLLRLSDEMHELVLSIVLVQAVVVVGAYFVVNKILISVEDSFSFESVHCFPVR